jgi:PleD family two-component response regulator
MGVATMRPTDEWDETELIKRADLALYLAKKEGRNQAQVWVG